MRKKYRVRWICRLRIHWPEKGMKDITGRKVYICQYCHCLMIQNG